MHFSFGYRPRYDSPNYDHERYDDDRYEYGLDDYEAVPGTDRYVARSRGWDLLAEGHAEEAIRVFANQAENNPRHGVPKVGYALSAAALGDLSTGVWAMRRACRYDPQAMEDMHLPDELQPTVDRLVAAYEKEPAGDADTQFMLSSLYALQGERRAAETAITRAIDRGDRRTSTVNLKRVIDSQTARAEERAPATGPPAQNPEPSAESGVSIDSKRTLQAPPKPPKPDIGN